MDHKSLHDQSTIAIAGIAKPERFFETLESLGVPLARRIQFTDHHAFTAEDIAELSKLGEDHRLITTEKDSVRLDDTGLDNFLHLRISANIWEFDRLMKLIRSRFS